MCDTSPVVGFILTVRKWGVFFDDRLGCVRHKFYYFILGNVVVPRHVVFNEHLFERTPYIDDAKEQNGFAEIINLQHGTFVMYNCHGAMHLCIKTRSGYEIK